MTPVWELRGLVRRFRGPGGEHAAVDGVDLLVSEGERVALIGESGSGKTTLARVGLGLLPQTAGAIRLLGEDTGRWSARRWLEVRHEVQLLFQDPRAMLNPAMRIGRLLVESAILHRPESDPAREVARVLDEVDLAGRERAWPHELSGGERRRVGLARLLLARPRLVVADEPTAGLDAARKASLVELLLDRVGPRCAVVLISHDLPMVTWSCERIVVMKEGRIVDRFPTSAVGDPARHAYTRELLDAAGVAAAAR